MNKIVNHIWSKTLPQRKVVEDNIILESFEAEQTRRAANRGLPLYNRLPCWNGCKVCEDRGYHY